MQKVSRITCINNGGFVMKFRVKWNDEESGWTDEYDTRQSKTFDLTTLNIPSGAGVRPEVQAEAGKSRTAGHTVEYDPDSGGVATWVVSGTTTDIHMHLEGN